MSEGASADQPRTTIAEAIAAWEAKGPTSLTVALLADALYGVQEALRTVVRLHKAEDRSRVAPEFICPLCIESYPCDTIRAIAAIWPAHPDATASDGDAGGEG